MGNLISSAVAAVFGWLGADLASRVVRIGSYLAGVATLTAVFVLAIEAAVSTLLVALPTDVQALCVAVLPRNLHICIGIAFGARVARLVYDWNLRFLDKATG